jgi:hypothetical protein
MKLADAWPQAQRVSADRREKRRRPSESESGWFSSGVFAHKESEIAYRALQGSGR